MMKYLTTIILFLSLTFVYANAGNTEAVNKDKTEKTDKKKKKAKQPKEQKETNKSMTLFLYGVSISLNDSSVYITDVTPVDGAYLQNKKFLGGASEYTTQMNQYFTKKVGDRRTNAVFFHKTRKDAEKAYMKLRKRYTKKGIELQAIPTGDFTFQAVRYEAE